jgi:hypothetical protein
VTGAVNRTVSRRASLFVLSLSSSALLSAASYACSPSDDFKGPLTNFELVEKADVIFIGKLVKSVGDASPEAMIVVEPETLLKGKALPKTAQIRGILSDKIISDGGKHFKVSAQPSDPFDIWRPHPETWSGSCSRYIFDKDMKVVLFFDNNSGNLEWIDPIFARGSEDVSDDKALWVRAVKIYAGISLLAKIDQRPALKKQMAVLRNSRMNDSLSELLVDDIERQLANCGPVSEFGYGDQICDNSKWVYNISNTSYNLRGFQSPIEIVAKAPKSVSSKFSAQAYAMIALVVIVSAALLVWRKRFWSKPRR